MKSIIKSRRSYNSIIIRQLSDTELVDRYNFMKKDIEVAREMGEIVTSEEIETKYKLLEEIKKRGLSYE